MVDNSTTIRVKRETWRYLKQSKEIDETMDEAISRLLSETEDADAEVNGGD